MQCLVTTARGMMGGSLIEARAYQAGLKSSLIESLQEAAKPEGFIIVMFPLTSDLNLSSCGFAPSIHFSSSVVHNSHSSCSVTTSSVSESLPSSILITWANVSSNRDSYQVGSVEQCDACTPRALEREQ